MSESGSTDPPEQRLQREADELEERLDRLEGDIDDAEEKARARRQEADPAHEVAGEWDETGTGTAGVGDDPEGAGEG